MTKPFEAPQIEEKNFEKAKAMLSSTRNAV